MKLPVLTASVLLAAAVPALLWAEPAWLQAWTGAREPHGQESGETRRRDGEVYRRRIVAKEGVIEALLEGRLTLLQAARWFQLLNEQPANCPDDYRDFFPGRSDGEKLCRQVLCWARPRLEEGPPSRAQALMAQLEAELEEHLCAHDGTVLLPGT
jgi:hypothetical protein